MLPMLCPPRWSRLVVVIALAVAVGGPSVAAADTAEVVRFARCGQASAAEYEVRLDGEVRLHRDFLDPKLSEDENLRLGVRHQIRYLWGWLHNNPEAKRRLQLVLAAAPPEVTITSRRAEPYGRDLVIDWTDTPELKVEDVYTARAVARGRVQASDPALVAAWSARFRVGLCSAEAMNALDVPLPADPWLFYWHVPSERRRKLRYFGRDAITTPCSDDDFADLPHPFYYWYDWQPHRRGPDVDGKPYDCNEWLRPGLDYFPRHARLERLSPPAGADLHVMRERLLAAPGPLLITAFQGTLDPLARTLDLDGLRRALGPSGRDPASRARAALGRDGGERAERKFLALLADLAAVLRPSSYRTRLDGELVAVDIEGQLTRSGRKARLTAYYGHTNIFGPVPPVHWSAARRALGRDHVVIYAGHSGIGENMRLDRIAEKLSVAPTALLDEVGRAPFQLVAFLSCYSYMYFGTDLLAAEAKRATPGREFILTGTAFTDGDRGTLAVLDLVDTLLATPATSARPSLRFVDPSEFFLFKGFVPSR